MIVTRRNVLYGQKFLTPPISISSIPWKPAIVKISVTLVIFLVVCGAATGWTAQKPGLSPGASEAQLPAEPEVAYTDPLGRSTPYGTLSGFIRAAERGNYQRASNYLQSKQSAKKKEELARLLKVVLDRGLKVSMDDLSKKPEGNLDDGLSLNLENVGVAEYGDQSLDILLHRVDQKGAPPIWLFSPETLLGIPDAAEQLDLRLGEKIWPKSFTEIRFLTVPLFMWINNLLLVPLVLGFAWFLTRGLFMVLRPLLLRRIKELSEREVTRITGPIIFLIFSLLVRIITPLTATMTVRTFWTILASVLVIMSLTWFLVRLTNLVKGLKILRLRQAKMFGRFAGTELFTWLLKALWVVAGLFLIVRSFGIDVTAAVAGLGVGGIAIAFAAQKTIENLFGTVTVITDEPIRIGDLCQAGNIKGWVESIGLRSTRIRTPDRTLVTIPNGELAVMSLENFAMRDKIWFHHTLRLRYETTADQLRYIIAEARKMLHEHPKVESPSARVHLIGLGNSSLDLEIFAYVAETVHESFLHIQGDLLLRVMDIIEASGSGFALPSQTAYLAQDVGLDAAKSQKAVETVQQWREQGELPFPDFSPERISQIGTKIEYSPPDSTSRDK